MKLRVSVVASPNYQLPAFAIILRQGFGRRSALFSYGRREAMAGKQVTSYGLPAYRAANY